MRTHVATFSTLTLATLVHCSGAPQSGEPSGETSQAATPVAQSGFATFGGSYGLCLGVNAIGAGVPLVSVGCTASALEGWRLGGSGGARTLSPQNDTRYCVENVSGTPVLEWCSGATAQQWSIFGGQIQPVTDFTQCLDVLYGSTSSPAVLDVTTCNGTPAQDFWPWGLAMELEVPSNGTCVTNPGGGQQLEVEPCSYPAASSQIFYGTTEHTIQQYTSGEPWDRCLAMTNLQGYGGVASMQPCDGTTGQMWSFSLKPVFLLPSYRLWEPEILNYAQTRFHTAECLDVQGGVDQPSTPVDTYTCNGSPAQLVEVNLL